MTGLLQLRGIVKRFGAFTALKGVPFDLRAGEIHALMGENGAGKSTLIKVITGVHEASEGTIEVAGRVIRPRSPREAEAAGISTVFQEVNLLPNLSLAENILMGRQPMRGPFIRHGEMKRRARAALARRARPLRFPAGTVPTHPRLSSRTGKGAAAGSSRLAVGTHGVRFDGPARFPFDVPTGISG